VGPVILPPETGAIRIIDTHCHLDWAGFAADRAGLLERARRAGVAAWVVPGVSRDGWAGLECLAGEEPGCWPAPGVHPQQAAEWSGATRAELVRRLGRGGCVAIGEIGLDRAIDVNLDCQKQAFGEQLAIAADFGLPVLLHVRRTHGQALEMVQAAGVDRVVWHCYSGSAELVRQVRGLDHYFSLSGAITWPTARKFEAVLTAVPRDRLLIETDAPDLAPFPHRGQTCLPEYIGVTLRRMGELTGLTLPELAACLLENTLRVLGKEIDHGIR